MGKEFHFCETSFGDGLLVSVKVLITAELST